MTSDWRAPWRAKETMVIEMYGKYDCTYITTWWLEHRCVRFLDLEQAGGCDRFKQNTVPILLENKNML